MRFVFWLTSRIPDPFERHIGIGLLLVFAMWIVIGVPMAIIGATLTPLADLPGSIPNKVAVTMLGTLIGTAFLLRALLPGSEKGDD